MAPLSHQSNIFSRTKLLPVPQQDIANRDRRTLEIDLDDVAAVSSELMREGESTGGER
jgi:hypothetical protein